MSSEDLVGRAERAAAHAHAPYSGIRVGAVVQDDAGNLHVGVNVESASYGLSLCAERAALARAIADGASRVVAVGVGRADGASITPCGACRQVIADLAPQARVAMREPGGAIALRSAADLLPGPFTLPAP